MRDGNGREPSGLSPKGDYRTSKRRMRFFSPLNSVGSASRRLFCDALLCRNWWLLCDFRRVIFPVPVILNRLAAVLFVFSFGILLLSYGVWAWDQNHDHQLAVQSGRSLDSRVIRDCSGHALQLLSADFGVRDFTRSKLASDFDLVPLSEELNRVLQEKRYIMLRDARTDLYTLYLGLFFLGLPRLLARQVLVLAVIQDLTDGWLGTGRDHHEVKALLLRMGQSLPALQNAKLFAVGVDHAHVAKSQNAFVHWGARIWAGVSPKSSYVLSPRLWTTTRPT